LSTTTLIPCRLIVEVLQEEGFSGAVLRRWRPGSEALKQERFDLVLADIKMPAA